MSDAPDIQMQDVFVLSGIPDHTFVQPVEYTRLLVALRTSGRSLVIEGPSGIGKTTSVIKAIAEAGLSKRVLNLSARKPRDLDYIRSLPNQLPIGTVVIDDFHRLDISSKRELADLMKILADDGAADSKLIVLGIPNAGQSLISFGKDLANRIEVIPFEANPRHKVEELIQKGELVLNITINIREEITSAAEGSFYIAQMLCYHTCIRSNFLWYSSTNKITAVSYEAVKFQVMESLLRSFHSTVIAFSRGTKLRREGRAPYLHLLYWLSQSKNWSINTEREADRHPDQKGSVSQVISKGFLEDLVNSSSDIQAVIHYEPIGRTLVVQDPQFIFYLRNLSWVELADEVGFLSTDFPSRYDFALSFSGVDRDIAEGLFTALEEAELEVFYDKNEQHRILAADVEEYLGPIYASDAQFVICILGPDYPKRVWTKFESTQFKQRFRSGDVIPIVMSTAPLGVFDSAARVGHISWDRSADFDQQLANTTDLLLKKCADARQRRR